MANRPANAGAHSAGPQRGPAAGPPVHRGLPRSRTAPARRRTPPARAAAQVVAWLPYLIVLAGVAAGLFATWRGSLPATRGAAVAGGSLLAAAAARLLLPPAHAGLLASRGKALDVAIFAMLGAAVLAVALSLP